MIIIVNRIFALFWLVATYQWLIRLSNCRVGDAHSWLSTRMSQSKDLGSGSQAKPKKESILDLSKYIDKAIRVKFSGGREVSGMLKGYDPLLNLVLDGCVEYLRDPDDNFKITDDERQLGLVVCRGTAVVLICPHEGMEPIANPFVQAADWWSSGHWFCIYSVVDVQM